MKNFILGMVIGALVFELLFYIFPNNQTIEVIDGDTLKIGDTRYRLWGIDAPEMNTQEGKDAKVAMTNILSYMSIEQCKELDTDRYGRVVLRCDQISCEMISQGHAKDWPKYSGGFYGNC